MFTVKQLIRDNLLIINAFLSNAKSRPRERNSNTAFSPIAENHSKTILYAIGYRMGQVNSPRRKRPRRDGFNVGGRRGLVNTRN